MVQTTLTRSRLLLSSVGFFLIGILVWHIGLKGIYIELVTVDMRWLFMSVACVFLSTCIGAVNAYILLPHDVEVPFARFLMIYWTAWAIGLVIPGQIGDVASIGVLLRKRVSGIARIMGRVFLDKVISLVIVAIFAIIGILSLPNVVSWDPRALIWIGIAALLGAAVICAERKRLLRFFDARKPGVIGAIRRAADEFFRALGHHRVLVTININLTAVKIGLTGFAYWATFAALGHLQLSVLQVVMLAVAAGLVAYLPLSLNGVGTVEIAGIVLFGQIGLSAATVLSAYLLLRMIVYTLAWTPASIWLFMAAANER